MAALKMARSTPIAALYLVAEYLPLYSAAHVLHSPSVIVRMVSPFNLRPGLQDGRDDFPAVVFRRGFQQMVRFCLRFENLQRIAECHSPPARGLADFCGLALAFLQVGQPQLGNRNPVCFEALANELASHPNSCEIDFDGT